jgi:membrane-associated phospholipid phosphatase
LLVEALNPALAPGWTTPRHASARLWPGAALRIAVAVAWLLTAAGVGLAHAAAESLPPRPHLLSSADARYGAIALSGVTVLGLADRWVEQRVHVPEGSGSRRFAGDVQSLGTPQVLGPGLLLGMIVGRVLDRPGLTQASLRVSAAIIVGGVVAQGIKHTVGRYRPQQAKADPDEFKPFSAHDSFPSGHTVVAFAAATAISRESSARWVPWVAYPLAGLVAWSRLSDDEHWFSDVAGGAAVGFWAANKVEDLAGARSRRPPRVEMLLSGKRKGVKLAAHLSF